MQNKLNNCHSENEVETKRETPNKPNKRKLKIKYPNKANDEKF